MDRSAGVAVRRAGASGRSQKEAMHGSRKGRRRQREPLSRERILEKALELIGGDAEAEISMRALADALGTAPMSLYRHIRNKDDLLDGVTSLVLGRLEFELPADGDWSERTLAWMHGVRSELHEHPAVLPLLRTHTRYAPAFLRTINSLLAILREGGFEDADVVRIAREVIWFTFGFAMTEIRSRQEYPGVEVGALVISALPPPDSPEIGRIPDLVDLLPHFMKGATDETFAAGASHLLAGLAASLDPGSDRATGDDPARETTR
jgi:AcrR family transcriptional regulator